MSAKKLLNFANLYGEVPGINQWFAGEIINLFLPVTSRQLQRLINILLAASVCVLHRCICVRDHFCFLLVWSYCRCLMCKYSEHTCYPFVAYVIDNFDDCWTVLRLFQCLIRWYGDIFQFFYMLDYIFMC